MLIKVVPRSLLVLLGLQMLAPAHAAAAFDCLIEPTQSVDIGSPVVGLLDKIYVQRGDRVVKGQVLATLESRAEAAAAALARYKSEMLAPTETAESKVEFSRKKFQRRGDMHANNFMSEQDKDDAESEMKLAVAELKLAQENKQMAKLEWEQQSSLLNLRTIRSPLDGVVADQLLYPGEIVEPSGQKKAIFKLAQLDPLRVRVILPMAMFGQIKKNMRVDVSPEFPIGGSYVGRVNVIDRLVDAASGTFAVYMVVANPKLDVPAGVKCRVQFPTIADTSKK